MKIARSHALGLVIVFFLILLLMWARYLRGVLGW